MKCTGTVKGGAVVLPPNANFEDGQQVEIFPASPSPEASFALRERTQPFLTPDRLPDDLAINHDYYLHCLPKQQPRQGRWIPFGQPIAQVTEQEASDYTDKLIRLAAETRNLPADLSANHDHYLHGLPKR